MKDIYVVATGQSVPVAMEALRQTLESQEAVLNSAENGQSFSVSSQEVEVRVCFEAGLHLPHRDLVGSEESQKLFRAAKGFYRISFEPGKPQSSVAVFEALWCARAILEHAPGVLLDLSSTRLHDAHDVEEITDLDFDIRDHVNLHALEVTEGDTPLWVHSHGMEKFGVPDAEIFHLAEGDLPAAESFLHELCTELAFGQGPAIRTLVETSNGEAFMIVPSDEARVNLMGVPLETFEGHEGMYLTVVSPVGRHNLSELLRAYRENFEQETEERTQEMRSRAKLLLPAFKARFQRRGLMEPLAFMVRAPFETHPEGDPATEHLWLEVVGWEERKLIGKLLDGASATTEWRKGALVEIDEDQVNSIAVQRDGRALEEEQMRELLLAERPI